MAVRFRSLMASPVIYLIWLFSLSSFARGQSIMASNLTSDLPATGTTRFLLNGTSLGVQTLRLYPLTNILADMSTSNFENFNITGDLVNLGANNVNSVESGDIAYISCDSSAYTGFVSASTTFELATQAVPTPAAIILYSTSATHCNYSSDGGYLYTYTFTTVDPMVAYAVANRNTNSSDPSRTSGIFPDESAVPHSSSSNGTSSGNAQSSSGSSGSEPTTATAMIILYAITGIITLLFLIIIITGAVRAHRHPERYGPRNIIGRPRQSRARGIARAMLETIPVVKFGEQEPEHAKPTDDIELAAPATPTAEDSTSEEKKAEDTSNDAQSKSAQNDRDAETRQGSTAAVATTRPDGTDEHGSLGCSICTEDFTKGQDIRVLPCNHKFHPDCVDPWLLNVSGTCPLCRINLNPEATEENAQQSLQPENATAFQLPPPLGMDVTENRRFSRMSRSSLAQRMNSMTPTERLAAARQLHDDGNRTTERPRLSERLRSRLGVSTRRQSEVFAAAPPPSETVEEAPASTQAETSTPVTGEQRTS